jgi:mannosyltransferase
MEVVISLRRLAALTSARVSVGTLAPLTRPAPSAGGAHLRSLLSSPVAVSVAALTFLAAALRFVAIGHQGFWFDEGNTALLVHFSPGKMLGLIPQSESTPPLYYCLAWVWARIFGYGEAGLRSLSALAGVLTVPVAFGAARKLISGRAGLIAAGLVACNPLLIWYSQEARSYSLLVLLTAVSLLAFAYAVATPSRRTLSVWVIASGLALATHYYALLAIVPQALWLLAAHWRRRAVQVAIVIVGVCGLALIPLAISQNGTGNSNWIAPIPLSSRLGQIFPQFLIGFGAPAHDALYAVAAVTVLLALILLLMRSDVLERRISLLLGGLALGGLVLNLVLVAVGVDDLITRNVIVLWLPAALMVAGGLGARGGGLVGVVGAAVLCATGIVAAVGVATDRNLQRPDWRVLARALGPPPSAAVGAGAQAGRAVAGSVTGRAILVQHYRDLLPLSLYLRRLRFMPRAGATVRELDVVSISAPRVALCWWGAACNLSPTQIQSSYPIPGFHELRRRRARQFTVVRLVSPKPVVLTRQEVASVLTTTTLPRDELLLQR